MQQEGSKEKGSPTLSSCELNAQDTVVDENWGSAHAHFLSFHQEANGGMSSSLK